MFQFDLYLSTLIFMLLFAMAGWLVSVILRNVTLVDSMWSLFFLIAALICLSSMGGTYSGRAIAISLLVLIWSLRLSVYLTYRNWGKPEDHRYQAIRKRNQPFWIKSLYIIFGLQAALAWIISLPLHAAIISWKPPGFFDYAGLCLFLIGFYWETIADLQLARFKADSDHKGKVLNTGLWRYSRHPNYFGEACIWWGFYLIAFAAGAWWSFPAPVLMTFLLLKVSGVSLLEKDISERRPQYVEYIRNTNAFIPGKPKS